MFYSMMERCRAGDHADCPGGEYLTEQEIQDKICGGGTCSCDCHIEE